MKAGLPTGAFDAFVAALEAWREIGARGAPNDRYAYTMQMINAVMQKFAERGGEMNDLAAMLRRFAADQARDAARDHLRLKPGAGAIVAAAAA